MSAVINIDFLEDNPDPLLQNINVNLEYTSKEVAQLFQANILPFVFLFNGEDAEGGIITPEDADNREDMGAAINNLLVLARAGIPNQPVIPNDPNSPLETKFLTVEMARDLELLLDTFKLAKIPLFPAPVPITEDQARLWKSIAVQSPVAKLITRAIDVSAAGNRTLQALIELEYIKTGSEVLADNLKSLEKALKATKDALDILEEIQLLHNKVSPEKRTIDSDLKSLVILSSDTSPSTPEAAGDVYEGKANEDFGNPLNAIVTDAIREEVKGTLPGLETRLDTVIAQIQAISPDAEEGSLLARLQAVKGDFPDDPTVDLQVDNWLQDGYVLLDDSAVKGVIQDNITFAVTAGQSLNDSQKEDVRRILFVFEEYYKSAAALLIKITQLVEKIAQGIAR